MTANDIQQIIHDRTFPFPIGTIKLVETHISWVILTDEYVYKLKKPVDLGYLDYSTLDLRNKYCYEELRLNRRLARDIYIDVIPVKKCDDKIVIGGCEGKIIDYALLMRRMDESRQMDLLLQQNKVSENDIIVLAEILADFHTNAVVIPEGEDWKTLYREFENIRYVLPYLTSTFGQGAAEMITDSMSLANNTLYELRSRIHQRNTAGWVIDGHGDLHARNIILAEKPIVFDCIDFNEDFRKLDVLSEIAFLCMDLERFGAHDLSEVLTHHYFSLVPTLETTEDQQLFLYYKMYRANVLLKVHCTRAMAFTSGSKDWEISIENARSYLNMYRKYYGEMIGEVMNFYKMKAK